MSADVMDEPIGKKPKLSTNDMEDLDGLDELNQMPSLQENNSSHQINGSLSSDSNNSMSNYNNNNNNSMNSMQSSAQSSSGSVLQDLLLNPTHSQNSNNSPRNFQGSFPNRSPMPGQPPIISPPTTNSSLPGPHQTAPSRGMPTMRPNVSGKPNAYEKTQQNPHMFTGQSSISQGPGSYPYPNQQPNQMYNGQMRPPSTIGPNQQMVAPQQRMINPTMAGRNQRITAPAGMRGQPSPAHQQSMMVNNAPMMRQPMAPHLNPQLHPSQSYPHQITNEQRGRVESFNNNMTQNTSQIPGTNHFQNMNNQTRPAYPVSHHMQMMTNQNLDRSKSNVPIPGQQAPMMMSSQGMPNQTSHGNLMHSRMEQNQLMVQRNSMGNIISGTQDPEKRKLIQQQLVLLLHAHRCASRERNATEPFNCVLPHCKTMKEVLLHINSCTIGGSCQYSHCASSRQIITHWKNCKKESCPVCAPLHNIHNSIPRPNTYDPNSNGPHNMPNSFDSHIKSSHSGYSDNLSYQQSSSIPSNASSNENDMRTDYFRSPNPPNKVISGPNSSVNGSNNGTSPGYKYPSNISFPPPERPARSLDWHQNITDELRNHLVQKLVKAIFPQPDSKAYQDKMLMDLITYARKVEKEMFENAKDKEEYYHLLAEKIYKIQKELKEKKNKRLNIEKQDPQNKSEECDNFSSFHKGNSPNCQKNSIQNGGYNLKVEVKQEIEENKCGPKSTIPSGDKSIINDIKREVEPGLSSAAIKSPIAKVVVSPTKITKDTDPVKKEVNEEICHPVEEKIFTQQELASAFLPLMEQLESTPEGYPFKDPVDPDLLGIPDYFDVVKRPMDFYTIKKKLNEGNYKTPWDVVDDVWLMCENAWLYNKKNSKVHKCCTKINEYFVKWVEPIMKDLGYCCGNKLTFTPLALFCNGTSMCVIGRDQPYYLFEADSSQFGVTVSDKYIYCVKCYEALPEEGINLSDSPNEKKMAPKKNFQLMKNDQLDSEPFENCKICKRKWHKICALYNKKIFAEGFICETCRRDKSIPKSDNKFTAKKLPHCHLSRFIEDRVNIFMNKNGGIEAQDYEVVIRVLAVQDKEVEVKPHMKERYGKQGFPEKFPYRTKAIFAFEVVDGVEVCFFGLHVQEYGSNCPPPNKRRVYIAYLDSVHFFQPRHLRTDVYHEILLAYLDYVKDLGYTMAHIWACPPSEGDDYIFHCHPPEQKIPKPKRLQDWYKKMLDKGLKDKIVSEYKDIYKQAKDDNLNTPMALPYFEGDFWPNVIEDCIKEVEKEENERRKLEAEQNDEDDEDESIATNDISKNKKTAKNSKKKGASKKASARNRKKGPNSTGNEEADKLLGVLEKHKEVFFTIRLATKSDKDGTLKEIKDPDDLMPSDLMDGRDTFLNKAREEHWEFSSLRRAKYSTICFSYALHVQSKDLGYTCNICQEKANLHCNKCDDFDLCNSCNSKNPHEHPMEKLDSDLMSDDIKNNESGNSRHESVQRCIRSLVHACQCRESNCRRPTCQKMRKVVNHTKTCKKRHNASCSVCKQLIALCCYHAKHCNTNNCPVPFCTNIRAKLQEQKRSLTRRADMMMRRRMEQLHGGSQTSTTSGSVSSDNSVQPSTPAGACTDKGNEKGIRNSKYADPITSGSNISNNQNSIGSSSATNFHESTNSTNFNTMQSQQNSNNQTQYIQKGGNNQYMNVPSNQITNQYGNQMNNSMQIGNNQSRPPSSVNSTISLNRPGSQPGSVQSNPPPNYHQQRQMQQGGHQEYIRAPNQQSYNQQQPPQSMIQRTLHNQGNIGSMSNVQSEQQHIIQRQGQNPMQQSGVYPHTQQPMAIHERLQKSKTAKDKEEVYNEMKSHPAVLNSFLNYSEQPKHSTMHERGMNPMLSQQQMMHRNTNNQWQQGNPQQQGYMINGPNQQRASNQPNQFNPNLNNPQGDVLRKHFEHTNK
uniref:histone acetyltransferase n=1 Tax=Strongyloides papillosus TaxID=174720 RepID=A0A0N5B8J3_STREA